MIAVSATVIYDLCLLVIKFATYFFFCLFAVDYFTGVSGCKSVYERSARFYYNQF